MKSAEDVRRSNEKTRHEFIAFLVRENMNGKISNFMEERKATVEEAPYMEMKTRVNDKNQEKDDIKPAYKTQPSQAKQTKEESSGLSLPLGEEYEKKKQKLKEELRLDYRRFMSEKKNRSIADPLPQSHMLSLPIREHKSAKEKLQNERNKEYNLFLRGHGTQRIGKHSTTPHALERECFGSVTPKHTFSPEVQAQRGSLSPEYVASLRRDVATITEPVPEGHTRPRRHWLEMTDSLGRPHEHYRDHTSSEEEQVELELVEKERMRNVHEDTDVARRDGKPDNRSHSLQALTPAQSRSVNEQNMSMFATGLNIGAAEGGEASRRRKERYRQDLLQQIAEQQNNKRREKELELRVAATAVIDPEKKPDRIKQFGAVTRAYEGKRRDVPYRPEVGLEVLRADSARRPKDQRPPQAPEERIPPERPRVAFQSPALDNSTVLSRLANASGMEIGAGLVNGMPINEDYHRGIASTMGDVVAPRVSGVWPPVLPSISETYQTPYDNVYYHYGARNPLDPHLANYGAALGHQANISPEAQWPILQAPSLTQQSIQAGVTPSGPAFPERFQPHKERALNYQEALKQQFLIFHDPGAQIQERQARRHREKLEKELYEAKIEAEMKAFEPWGRAGGGAPLRDDQGNLISDLKQMHKTNVEAYDSGGRVTRRNTAAPRTGDQPTKPTGFSSVQPPLHARGNLFNEPPTPRQIHEQEIYKEYLRQQIGEKRKKEAEERERDRLEEEKEERRLAEQRARIQREYEEEQERKRQKEKEQNAKNEELIRQAEDRREEAERKRKEAEERENEALRKRQEQEQRTVVEEVHRAPSPPLPALQKKLRQQVPRPPSVESHRSAESLTARSMSAPHSPPVPARRNEIRATEKRTVIRELSALHRQLRNEQRRLEGQLMPPTRNDNPSAVSSRQRERPTEDVFEMARLHKQVPIRRPASHTTAAVNMQNLHEFNRLKYRDTTSREKVRQVYPEPPTDDHSLDIQQQALLRQQQRTIYNLRRARPAGYFDMVSSGQQHPEPRRSSAEDAGRHLLLNSESAFIDPSSESLFLQSRTGQRARRDSARMRPAVGKTHINDDMSRYIRPDSGPDSQSAHSLSSMEIERLRERVKNKMTSLDDMREHDWRSGDASADEGEELWSQTPPLNNRRVSIETIGTESWLRPSSSDTLKRFIGGRRPSSRTHASQDWEGPSTYHG
ncbi:centrosome and spindle pole-associated protein 1 isoform X2 [Triplophysa rosa]|uniref:centrosome and spindle pole-associated protein 1 isoform X2 n=1 Tax=Triplophysa rosa TaxID=992332 RepID=UPI00254608E6|nr:centrosome and spindle pole-associated protein 1 isoform X2 [Triplophysa rosa]